MAQSLSSNLIEAKAFARSVVDDLINDPNVVAGLTDNNKIIAFCCKCVENVYKVLIKKNQIKLSSNEKLELALHIASDIAHSEVLKGKIPDEILAKFKQVADNSKEVTEVISLIIEVANQAEQFRQIVAPDSCSCFPCCRSA